MGVSLPVIVSGTLVAAVLFFGCKRGTVAARPTSLPSVAVKQRYDGLLNETDVSTAYVHHQAGDRRVGLSVKLIFRGKALSPTPRGAALVIWVKPPAGAAADGKLSVATTVDGV